MCFAVSDEQNTRFLLTTFISHQYSCSVAAGFERALAEEAALRFLLKPHRGWEFLKHSCALTVRKHDLKSTWSEAKRFVP